MNHSASGTAQAFENDEMAAALSLEVASKGWDTMDAKNYTFEQRHFVYLPLMHSEKIDVQVKKACVLCFKKEVLVAQDQRVVSFRKQHLRLARSPDVLSPVTTNIGNLRAQYHGSNARFRAPMAGKTFSVDRAWCVLRFGLWRLCSSCPV